MAGNAPGFCVGCRRKDVPLALKFARSPDTGICQECVIAGVKHVEDEFPIEPNGREVDGDDPDIQIDENYEKTFKIIADLKPRHYRKPYQPPSGRQATLLKYLPTEAASKCVKFEEFISDTEEFRAKSTKRLIEHFIACGLDVSETLAREVTRRDDSLNYLRAIFEHDEYWLRGGQGDGWTPIHALHILAMQGTHKALDLLLEVLRMRASKISNFLPESVPTLLAAFGEGSINKLETFISDETVDRYARNSAAIALTIIGHKYPAQTSGVFKYLLELLVTTQDTEFAAFQVDDLLSFRVLTCLPIIKIGLGSGRIDRRILEWDDVIQISNKQDEEFDYYHFIRDPVAHFSEENQANLRKVNYRPLKDRPILESLPKSPMRGNRANKSPKIGRNDPCPCGTGKKYKGCCLLKKRM